MARVLAIIIALIAFSPMVASAQAESGLWVCSVYNPSTGECTTFVPVAEGVMSGQAIGFTPEVVNLSIQWGLGIILVVWLVGITFGIFIRMITSAIDPGPL